MRVPEIILLSKHLLTTVQNAFFAATSCEIADTTDGPVHPFMACWAGQCMRVPTCMLHRAARSHKDLEISAVDVTVYAG